MINVFALTLPNDKSLDDFKVTDDKKKVESVDCHANKKISWKEQMVLAWQGESEQYYFDKKGEMPEESC